MGVLKWLFGGQREESVELLGKSLVRCPRCGGLFRNQTEDPIARLFHAIQSVSDEGGQSWGWTHFRTHWPQTDPRR